jgi:hypothetical protein
MQRAAGNSLGSIFRHARTRGYFEDGLRRLFPPCYEPMPDEIKQLVHHLAEAMDRPASGRARTQTTVEGMQSWTGSSPGG